MLKLNAVQKALDDAVALKGENYRYSDEFPDGDCTYSTSPEDGEQGPACIVGHVIYQLDRDAFNTIAKNEWTLGEVFVVDSEGYETDEVVEAWLPDAKAVDAIMDYGVSVIADAEDGVRELLCYAQSLQDAGRPWGRAVKTARENLEEV